MSPTRRRIQNLPEARPVTLKARDVAVGDRLATYSARRRDYRYENVQRVFRDRTAGMVDIRTAEGLIRLREDREIQIAPRAGSR